MTKTITRVLVDYDETLFATNEVWYRELEDLIGFHIDPAMVKEWDFSPALPAFYLPLMHVVRTAKMYRSVKPYPDGIEMCERLRDMGIKVIVVTRDTQGYAKAKRELLAEHYPGLRDSLVVAENKRNSVGHEFMVDDYPLSTADWFPRRPWNGSVPEHRRIWDLSVIPDLISAALRGQ